MTRKYPKFCDPTNDWAFKRIFGSSFVIEMQVVEQEFFRQRTVLYASTLISRAR